MMQLLVTLTMGLMLVSFVFGQASNPVHSLERTFADGGDVWLRLSSGDYTIKAGTDDRVLVRWRPDAHVDEDTIKNLRADIVVSGQTAKIRTDGPTKHARVTI